MLSSSTIYLLAADASASHALTPAVSAQLDRVMLLGFMSAVVTLACLPHVRKNRAMKLIFAISLGVQAVYGFLSGAWPMGLVAVVTSSMAAHRWWKDCPVDPVPKNYSHEVLGECWSPGVRQSRSGRLFGPNSNAHRFPNNN